MKSSVVPQRPPEVKEKVKVKTKVTNYTLQKKEGGVTEAGNRTHKQQKEDRKEKLSEVFLLRMCMCEYRLLFVLCQNVMYYYTALSAVFGLDLRWTSFHYYYYFFLSPFVSLRSFFPSQ